MDQSAVGSQKGPNKGAAAISNDKAEAVEKLGAAIINLLRQGDEIAKQDAEIAFAKAHKVAVELRASEHLTDSLKSQVNALEQRARKAEDWLLQVRQEIEEKFLLSNTKPNSQRL